jgi:surface antigen
MAMAANPPTTISPGYGSSPGMAVGSLTPNFSWNSASGATGYGLYIRDMTAAGTPLIYPNSVGTTAYPLTGTSFTLPNGYLVNGHIYRWNMTSFVGATEGGAVSVALYFQTPAAAVAATSSPTIIAIPPQIVIANPPTINAPGNPSSPGTMLSSLTPTFGWNWASGATGYGLYIRDMTAAGTPLIYPNSYGTTYSPLTGSSLTLPGGYLVNGHIYRWNMTSFTGSKESSGVSGALYFQTPSAFNAPVINSPSTGSFVGAVAANPTPTVAPSSGNPAETAVTSLPQTDYPNQFAPYCPDATPNSECQQNTKDDWGFFNRECTSYVAWKMNQDAGTTSRPYFFSNSMRGGQWGNAENWDSNAVKIGFLVDHHPAVGAIAQWEAADLKSSPGGHVAYVEAVNADGSVNVSEFNYHLNHNFDIRSKENGYTVWPPRFIHITHSIASTPSSYPTTISSLPNNGGTVSSVVKPAATSSPQISTSVQNQTKPITQQAVPAALILNTLPSNGGIVIGGGNFASGSSVTVSAMPSNGFVFEYWTENGRIVSSSASYNFTLNGSRSLVANFRQNFMNHSFTQSPTPNSQNRNPWSIQTFTPNSSHHTNQFFH